MGNHLGAGIAAATATASAGVFLSNLLSDILDARNEKNLQNRLQRYEQMQNSMMEKLKYYEELADKLERNVALAEDVIKAYETEVIPVWKKGAEAMNKKIAQSEEYRRAENEQLQALKLELAQSRIKVSDLQGLHNAAMRMVQDLQKQNAESEKQNAESELRGHAAQTQVGHLQREVGRLQNEVTELKSEVQRKAKSLETFRAWHAANLSLRCALEMQLLRADPENPLLHDQDLRERVRRAGEMTVALLDEKSGIDPFDMAREAGLTFDVPGRPSGVQVLTELALTEVYMRRLAFLHAEGEETWQALHKVQIGHGAMTAARDLLQQKDPESALLQASAVQQVHDLAMSEFQRQQQQRRLSSLGPSAAWSAAVAGQQTVRQRAVENLEYLIEEEVHSHHGHR